MLTATFCTPWGVGAGGTEVIFRRRLSKHHHRLRRLNMRKHSLVLFLFFFHLTRAVSRNVGETGTKTRSLTEVKLQGESRMHLVVIHSGHWIHWILSKKQLGLILIHVTLTCEAFKRHCYPQQITVKHVCNYKDTRQPWFLERFWDNEFLIPQSHPDTMRKKKKKGSGRSSVLTMQGGYFYLIVFLTADINCGIFCF